MSVKQNPLRILVVEDDSDDAFLLSRQLKKMTRFEALIETEQDLDCGLLTASTGDYDGVFLDYYWGHTTADRVLQEQRSSLASVPVVVITSTDDFEINEKVVDAGAWDFIAKEDLTPKLLERTLLHTVERKRHEQEMNRLIRHDSLTGLGNRMMFDEQLQKAVSRADRQNSRCAVLALDLDDFKQINDSLGHDVGDMLLRLVADRLQRGLRAEDTLARLGGDEFAVLIEDVEHLSSLETIAEKLLEAIRQPTPIRGITGRISGSFGIAVYPDNAKSPLELMRYADIALYSSKDAGRDRVSLFNDDLEKELVGSLAMEQELRRAIERSEFVPFFQPRYGCCDNHLYGVEVLARWAHPTQGILLPAEFMHVAEKAGLMLQMDRALIRKTLGLLRDNNALPSEDAPYRIAFNITAAQLLDTGFADEMASLASEFGVAANLIEFEIVEDILVERHARDTLHALRKAGFGLAIDDFGTGFSSFAYLRDLPVTALKLDRSFVKGLDQDRINRGICEAIVCAGKRLDLIVIGEGVENQGELDSLRELGVDSVQGFLLARPMKPEQWIALQRALKLEGADGE